MSERGGEWEGGSVGCSVGEEYIMVRGVAGSCLEGGEREGWYVKEFSERDIEDADEKVEVEG